MPTLPKKVLFIGLGGAGQRHLRIFSDLLPGAEFSAFRSGAKPVPLLKKDFSVDSSSTVEARYNVKTFTSLAEALIARPDLAVISTPTSLHLAQAQQVAEAGVSIFMEKPVSHSLEGLEHFEKTVISKSVPFFMAYPRRAHPAFQDIRTRLTAGELGTITGAAFHVASYVPAWHPYEDFKNLYACRKDLGGGVLLTEIHELDLCAWFFGKPKTVEARIGNFSNTPMDVEDTAHVTLGYEGFSVAVDLCFMQPQARRDFWIRGTRGEISWSAADTNNPTHEELFVMQAKNFLNDHYGRFELEQLSVARDSLEVVERAKRYSGPSNPKITASWREPSQER